jgi:hypothetical protein
VRAWCFPSDDADAIGMKKKRCYNITKRVEGIAETIFSARRERFASQRSHGET